MYHNFVITRLKIEDELYSIVIVGGAEGARRQASAISVLNSLIPALYEKKCRA
jgi:hypothetical protein